MNKFRKPLQFTLKLLPFAAAAGFFVTRYQLDLYPQETIETLVAQFGSKGVLIAVSTLQAVLYAAVCGFFGYILSEKIGLMHPIRFEKKPLIRTLGLSLFFGILFSLDPWVFGRWIPELSIQDTAGAGMSLNGWLGSILYGGIMEELMLRLFFMSLIAWLLWKVLFRKQNAIPDRAVIAANWISCLVFAAGHLPTTKLTFGTLTPILLFRCFLMNGGFGLVFGWLYRKHGIQYAMMSHALLHIVSKTVWLLI